ncbi:hypothetical protein JHK87_034232 [Glycine soja]|nr:hypothetical protein JHK87_034232 [Glycine soja]
MPILPQAYVCGEREGLILEAPHHFGVSLNGVPGPDIDMEKKKVEDKLNQLRVEGATEHDIELAMKDLGTQRATMYGWPNTYVFTKAMGEMLVGTTKGNMNVVIVRPTMVTSTYKEPFPGWIEGLRTIDSIVVAYGKGKLVCFLANLEAVFDVIPADMVVNAMLVAMVAHANQPSDIIYHLGSSVVNPVMYLNLRDYSVRYFTEKPWINRDGKPVKGLELVNAASCQYFQKMYLDFNRKIRTVLRLVELYKPYLFFNGVFDNTNTEKLLSSARQGGVETELFYFDTKMIDWEDYFINIHFPGIIKYAFK